MDIFGNSESDNELNESNNGANLIEIKSITGVGGERGLFAVCDIEPGVLLLSEIPTMVFNGNFRDKYSLANGIEVVVNSKLALLCTKSLFPLTFPGWDNSSVLNVKNFLTTELLDRMEIDFRAFASDIDKKEILRIALVLQHNCFGSGLYKDISLINHSCAPNCVKYFPSKQSFNASEIWTVEKIKAGDEILIDYCAPAANTKSTITKYLMDQHCFSCHCDRCNMSESSDIAIIDSLYTLSCSMEEDMEKYSDDIALSLEDKQASMHLLQSSLHLLDHCLGESSMGTISCICMLTFEETVLRKFLMEHQELLSYDCSLSQNDQYTCALLLNRVAVLGCSIGHEMLSDKLERFSECLEGHVEAEINSSAAEVSDVLKNLTKCAMYCVVTRVGMSFHKHKLQKRHGDFYVNINHVDLATYLSDVVSNIECLMRVHQDLVSHKYISCADHIIQRFTLDLIGSLDFWNQLNTQYLRVNALVDTKALSLIALLKIIAKKCVHSANRLKQMYSSVLQASNLPNRLRSPGDVYWGVCNSE